MFSDLNILIADDDNDDIHFLSEALLQIISSCNISSVSNGLECLDYLKTNSPPHIIFLDLKMPKVNGLNCLKWIKDKPHLQETSIVIYSTSGNSRDIDACYDQGASFYIIKPVRLTSLTHILTRLFTYSREAAHQGCEKEQFVLNELNH